MVDACLLVVEGYSVAMSVKKCLHGRRLKVSYDTLEEAEKALNDVTHGNKRRISKIPVRIYSCDRCGGYHTTAQRDYKGRNSARPMGSQKNI